MSNSTLETSLSTLIYRTMLDSIRELPLSSVTDKTVDDGRVSDLRWKIAAIAEMCDKHVSSDDFSDISSAVEEIESAIKYFFLIVEPILADSAETLAEEAMVDAEDALAVSEHITLGKKR